MFPEDPKARSDFRAGTLYAIWGPWIYYGQVCADNQSPSFVVVIDRLLPRLPYWSHQSCRGYPSTALPSDGHFDAAWAVNDELRFSVTFEV